MYLENLVLLEKYITNNHYYERYKKLIRYYYENVPEQGTTEKHHILPRKLFPDFIKSKWNIIILPARAHFLAHYLLAKSTNNRSMWFAFNQMRRVGKKSILYEYARKRISEIISETNSGKVMTKEQKDFLSDHFKNTVVVKDSEGNTFRVSCDDDRYKSGDLVFYRTGSSHKKETIERMKKNSGIRGKVVYENAYTGEKKYFRPGEQPMEYFLHNFSKEYRHSVGNASRNKSWYHDPLTKEARRFGEEDNIPFGWLKGRGKDTNEGFQFVKERMVQIIDLLEKKVTAILKEDFDSNRHSDSQGRSAECSVVYVFDGYIFTKKTLILKAMEEKYGYVDGYCLDEGWICTPFKSTNKRLAKAKVFKNKHKDWTLKDFDVTIVRLEDFDTTLLDTHQIRSDVNERLRSSK
jgi:hypothetical protein